MNDASVKTPRVTGSCDDASRFHATDARHTFVRRARSVLDDPPARESRLEVVPERDVLALPKLPAQVDLATAELRPEVDEPAAWILHLDAEVGHLAQQHLDLTHERLARTPPVADHAPLEVLEERPRSRQQRLSLSAGE